jgi:hypothetical protein
MRLAPAPAPGNRRIALVSAVFLVGREAEVAALLGPLLVLFGQDGADRRSSEVRSGKMPTTSVRRRISWFSHS